MRLYFLLYFSFFFISTTALAQDAVFKIFKDTRVINQHSPETLQKRKLDIRIGHRFGDLFGGDGGWNTFFGLEAAADVLIGGEYGISDKLTVGISRTKGAGGLQKLINPIVKYKLINQTAEKSPFTITGLFVSSISTMPESDSPDVVSSFKIFSHRIVYGFQAIVGRKFSDRFSAQVVPSLIHRNLTPFQDTNNLVSLGAAFRFQVTKVLGILGEVTYPFSENRTPENGYYIPIGVAFEFDTGGHIFQLNFTNSDGMMETDYIPYSPSNFLEGEFRIGFTISRLFNL